MSSNDVVQVVVSSRRIPARTVSVPKPLGIQAGFYFAPMIEQKVIYESVLDEPQLQAIEEAKRLSDQLGLPLEVIDESKVGPLHRFISKLMSLHGNHRPTLVLKKSWRIQDTGVCRPIPDQATTV